VVVVGLCAGAGSGSGPGRKLMMSAITSVWLRPLTIGTVDIAGSDPVGAASKLGPGTSVNVLRVVRTRCIFMRAARIRLLWLFSFGWIQPEHVQQDGGYVCHHDEGNEHDEP
jgi:hypothetical protein